ncbi:hypothetical protein N9M10_02630 [Hellea sp.]|nr:hypothetical protein [Hellea sp.]
MMTITRTGSPSSLIIIGFIFLVFGALMMLNNWKERDLDLNPMDLDAKPEIKAKLGATAGGHFRL